MAGADESSGAGASLAAAGGPQCHHISAEQVLLPAAPSSPASPSPELTWENLPPNAVVRVIMSFCRCVRHTLMDGAPCPAHSDRSWPVSGVCT